MKKFKGFKAVEKPLTMFDYVIFGILAIACYLCFQQGDIMHTAGSSYAYLQGHILDYYDWLAYEYNIWDAYMPSTYIVYAIWNIPMKLFGIVTEPEQFAKFWVIMWYKLLPASLYIISGFLIYKIATVIGMGSKKSKICAYAFLTAPIGFFSQFMFGQYDIFTIFFMLLGIYYYYKKNNKLFILYFALSVPFKLWSILFFIPLLLLREKNVWKIIRNLVFVAIPYGLELMLYIGNEVFRRYVLGFGATSYIYNAGLNIGTSSVSFVIVLWGFICAYAYFKKTEGDVEHVQWSLYLCTLVLVALFGLSQWHPQWLLLAMPFFVLSAFINRDTKIFMVIDLVMMVLFLIYTVNMWSYHVDQELFSWGIFGDYIYKYIGTKLAMKDLYVVKNMNLVFTLFNIFFVVSALFKHPKYCLSDFKNNVDNCIWAIRARFLIGVGAFIVPAVICFIVAMFPPYITFKTGLPYEISAPLINRTVSHVFVADTDDFEKLEFMVATYKRENDVDIKVSIVNVTKATPVYSTKVNAKGFVDNDWVTLSLDDTKFVKGDEYRIDISCYDADATNCICIYTTKEEDDDASDDDKVGYAIVDGKKTDYNLCVRMYSSKRAD